MLKALVIYILLSGHMIPFESRTAFDTMEACKAYIVETSHDVDNYARQVYGEYSSKDVQCVTAEEFVIIIEGATAHNKKLSN